MKEIIWDDYGMILQTGDGGDSAANVGTYHVYLETRRKQSLGQSFFDGDASWKWTTKEAFQSRLTYLHGIGTGLYRRHPKPEYWGSRTNTMSRDQTIPLLAAMALYGMKAQVWDYIKGHAKRGFLFATNTTPNWTYPSHQVDFTWWQKVKFFFGWDPGYPVYATKMPDLTIGDFWALELRGLYSPWAKPFFYPVLCGLDLFTLIGSATKVYMYGKDPSHSDDRNHVNCLLVGLQICPTFVIRLAAKLYSKRPKCEGASATTSGPQSALDHYYRAANSPPFNELARPIIRYYFE